MSEIRAKQIASLFAEARMLEPKARPRFLDDACQGDRELRVAIEELLTEVAPEDGLLGAVWSDGAVQTETLDPDAERAPPQQLGHYRLIRPIGRGGMGEVWLAEQREPIHRRVALKLIKLGMDTKDVLARFEAERQALAIMDHPNIAKVHDAGQTPEGRPYFVMEFINGEPITDYCDRQRLTIPERLALFMQACAGAQHAHHKAVIHRDIKPSNVMVSVIDGTPSVRIIDFGVAKAVGHSLTERTLFTERGVLVGTPEYMSPEQAEMGATDVDTRTDVYSLGVLLYELLTGVLPFDSRKLREAGYDEIRRRIREDEPSKPSTRIVTLGEASTESAQKRRVDPRTLGRTIQGDLDWITMRAIEKDRTRRYESPSALTEDLKRYLASEPVVAGPPNVVYRANRFVKRHRTGVVVASMVAIVVVSFATAMLVQARRISAANADLEVATAFQSKMLTGVDIEGMGQRLVEDLERRVFESAQANGLSDSESEELLGATERGLRMINGTDAARRLLDQEILFRAVEELDLQFQEHPGIDAQLRHSIGVAYHALGMDSEAERQLKRGAELRLQLLGADHTDTLKSMNSLAIVYLAEGRYSEAETLHLETLTRRRRVLGDSHLHTIASLSNLANVYWSQRRYPEAEPLFLEALETHERLLGGDHLDTLNFKNNLANLYWVQERFAEAESLHLEVLANRKRLLGEDNPDTASSRSNLGNLYWSLGRYDEAEPLYVETLETRRRSLGSDDPNTLSSMHNLAALYGRLGRHAEAERLYLEALAGRKRILRDDHPDTIDSVNNLANLYVEMGRYAEAEPLYLGNLEVQKRVFGGNDPGTYGSLFNLARLMALEGKQTRAMNWLRESIEAGLDDAKWLAQDPALESLRGPEFDALVLLAEGNAVDRRQ